MKKYLTIDEILTIHETIIKQFGGAKGIRDMGALQSAVGRIQLRYYTNIIQEAAALMESLVNNHPFLDGNKRVAFFASDVFLRMNGHYIDCDNEVAYRYFLNLFKKKTFKFEELCQWLQKTVKKLSI